MIFLMRPKVLGYLFVALAIYGALGPILLGM